MTNILNASWLIIFAAVLLTFGLLSDAFFTTGNLLNVLVQSSATTILAVGMTFVLLTAGVDLSVGSIMYLCGITAGMLGAQGVALPVCITAAIAVGVMAGAINGIVVARLRVAPFIVTLATLNIARGCGLLASETQGIGLPEAYQTFGASTWLGIPLPLLVMIGILVIAHLTLQHTTFGRWIYAIGHDSDAAEKAGIPTRRILFAVYAICGLCAAIAALVAMTQTGSVASKFGQGREFSAIAAAVLGGASLFGGCGSAFPGAVIGAVLIQTVENGLVLINADPYVYPLVSSTVIFLAVLIDSIRRRWLERLTRRRIRWAHG